MASCTLEIGGRIVARSEGGPFEAEYALFEAHEIELRSNNEPGTVREHGYRTTVELALERLDGEGITRALASQASDALGSLVAAYALGPEVRRVASLLGPAELFEGRVWHADTKLYEGGWLDVGSLAADSGVPGAARALQQLYLATLLGELSPSSAVYLSTAGYTTSRRPGERTYRRTSLASAREMPAVIGALADRGTTRAPRDGGPSRAELLDAIRRRLSACAAESARVSLEAIARSLAVRERPQRGPLADPDLWALELQLADEDLTDAVEKIDLLERSRGRQPGTAYLRARLALLQGTEDARQIAERASSLAMSMSSFAELELLVAEAWMRAGDRKRALAYAHVLADDPQVDATLRGRARTLLDSPRPSAAPASAVPVRPSSSASARSDASVAPTLDPPPPPPSDRPTPVESVPDLSMAHANIDVPGSRPASSPESSPMVSITAGLRASVSPPRASSGAPPRVSTRPLGVSAVSSVPPAPAPSAAATETPIAPTPIFAIGLGSRSAAPPAEGLSPPHAEGAPPGLAPATRPTRPSIPAARAASAAPPPPATISDAPPTVRPSSSPPPDDDDDRVVVRGGSRPPYVTEPPPPTFPAAPLVPRLEPGAIEKAETLSLPPGLHGESGASEPTNPIEARVYFTHRTRELGRLYRKRHDVELQMDIRSVEILQRHLSERFERGEIKTFDDFVEVRLHGAFLSELLARRLGAEWTDVAVSEMGYWAMNVPPGVTVWPIGRVLRFVTMQHKERDLVSYVLELQARAHGLK